nr:invasion associated locus B family protein [Agrobacterium tumefaciens]
MNVAPGKSHAHTARQVLFPPNSAGIEGLRLFFPDYGVKIAALIRIPEVSMRLSPLARTFLAAAGLAIIAPAAAALAQQQPPGTPKSTHGAWSVICDKPAGASEEQCALMQNVIADDRPEVGLSVVVLKTADRKSRILRILAPLGVLLKDGMELYIDNNNIGRAYFTRCFSEGCYVEVDIDDELLKVLRAGKNAVFALREAVDQDRVGIPIELSGFAEGYDALP